MNKTSLIQQRTQNEEKWTENVTERERANDMSFGVWSVSSRTTLVNEYSVRAIWIFMYVQKQGYIRRIHKTVGRNKMNVVKHNNTLLQQPRHQY